MAEIAELEKFKIEEETKRIGFRYELGKVVFGTMIVGLAAAAFPFAQKVAELTFNNSIEQKRLLLTNTENNRNFLEKIGVEGRSEDFERRIRLAEFYAHLGGDDTEKAEWYKYLSLLDDKRDRFIEKRADYEVNCVSDAKKTPIECAELKYELNAIERYLVVDRIEPNSQPCKIIRGAPQSELQLTDGRVAGVTFCQTPNRSNNPIIGPEFVIVDSTATNNLDSTVAWMLRENSRNSAHIIIDRDGTIVQLGGFGESLWHAGNSMWKGRSGLNQYAIGIALINLGRLSGTRDDAVSWSGNAVASGEVFEVPAGNPQVGLWHNYTSAQLESLVAVLRLVMAAYQIEDDDVVGQENVSPGRKELPGPAFPWEQVRARLR